MNKKLSILSIEYPWEATALRVLLFALALLGCLYLYFVAVSVLNIVAHKEADVKTNSLQSSIGDLEGQYLALSQQLTPGSEAQFGLAPISNTSYVYLPGNAAAASIPEQQATII